MISGLPYQDKPNLVRDPVFDGMDKSDIFYYMSATEIRKIKERIIKERFNEKLKDLKFKLNEIIIDNNSEIKTASEMESGMSYQVPGYIIYKEEKIEVNVLYYVPEIEIIENGIYDYMGGDYEKELEELYKKHGDKYIKYFDVMDNYIEVDISELKI